MRPAKVSNLLRQVATLGTFAESVRDNFHCTCSEGAGEGPCWHHAAVEVIARADYGKRKKFRRAA